MISHYVSLAQRHFDRLDSHQWVWLLIGIVVFGFFCMRGFGSRANY